MSYGTKYRAGWSSKNFQGYLYIDKEDYTGDVEDIILGRNGFSIVRNWEGWENYIIGATCSFEIVNDRSDYFELLPLMTATEREYKVRVEITDPSDSVCTVFEGFLNCEAVSQRYLHKQNIRLVASSYLSKLEYLIPDSIETLQRMSFIDIIDEILISTGNEYNIRVNSSLYAKDDTLDSGQTLFNKNGFFTEIFWEDNVERKNSLEILESILKTFNCYLYWWDEYWYIERYKDIWTDSMSYVEYTTGTSAGYDEDGIGGIGELGKTTSDVHTLVFTNESQTLKVIPGNRLIRVISNVDEGLLLNLTINDFEDATGISGVAPCPDLRGWRYYDDSDIYLLWAFAGSHNDISNCILRQWWKGGINYQDNYFYLTFDNIVYHRGLYTRFETTIDDDTKLKIKFKFGIDTDSLDYSDCKVAFWGWVLPEFTGDYSDYIFKFKYYLRMSTGNYYVVYNEGTEIWEVVDSNETDALQTHIVEGADFDPVNGTVEVSLPVIPLEDLGSEYQGDQDFVLGIGTEEIFNKQQDQIVVGIPAKWCWYGDVYITTNATLENNINDGVINTNFLNKKEITLDLFDIANKNYKSGVLRGADYDEDTEIWVDDEMHYYSLVDLMLVNKFRIYNISRQILEANVYSTQVLRLFQQFTESKQNDKKFLLVGLVYFPILDKYEVDLWEYDNSTEIIISEESMSPTVRVLGNVYNITSNSANANGEVTDEGDSPVYERGICWNTTGNPTLEDSNSSMGTGAGEYVGNLTDLEANTHYYVCAYAKNGYGIVYSDSQLEFDTLAE